MSENSGIPQDTIGSALAGARLEALKSPGQLSEADRKKRLNETLKQLEQAIRHSLFLEEERKALWLSALHLLSLEKAEELLAAILRENFRYKKGIRKLKFKEIPERAQEEVPAL